MSDHTERAPTTPITPPANAPMAAGEATDASVRRRVRLAQVGVVAALVAVALAVLTVMTGGRTGAPPRPSSAAAVTTARRVEALLAGIPQSANVLGSPVAPVTLKWFGDLECPFCRAFTLGALPSLIQRWVRRDQLRIEYRSMETATHEPAVFKLQQIAALAAGQQNKMWNFIELFYHEQGQEDSGYVTETYLQGLALQIPGLDLPRWTADRDSPALAHEVTADLRIVKEERFLGTPSFLIGPTGGPTSKFTPRSLTIPRAYDRAVEEVLGA
jgi:protein-disulfide isomerase